MVRFPDRVGIVWILTLCCREAQVVPQCGKAGFDRLIPDKMFLFLDKNPIFRNVGAVLGEAPVRQENPHNASQVLLKYWPMVNIDN